MDFDKELLLWFNGSDSIFMDNLMVVLTSGLTWIPLYLSLLYIVVKNNETMIQIFIVMGCALLCICMADGVCDLIVKPLVMRPRPCNDPVFKDTVTVVDNIRGSGYSFFSAHAANTFSLALFFCMLVRNKILSVT
ncbi:MAG: phosphatase PAP2 family protein, partial [Prevotella sp.]